ncbi:MAG: hypothetical protein FJ030_00525 [Chloroflexi bacterium]|nr:hypothetical protein [Chloroflexota bacterium]
MRPKPIRLITGFVFLVLLGSLWVVWEGGETRNAANIERRIDGDRLALAWTFDAAGPLNQLPARVGKVVLVAPPGGPLIALDVESGALRWQYDPPEGLWERSYAADERRVFVGLPGGRMAALDSETGKVQWERDLGIDIQSPPLIANGALYASTTFVGPGLAGDANGKAKLFALATADGRELWSFETDNYILQTPAIGGGTLYVGGSYRGPGGVEEGGHTRIYALSISDGALRWVYESTDGFVKRIYATESVAAFVAYQDFVSGLDADTGNLRWRVEAGNWVPSLSGSGDTIYFGSDNTMLQARDVNDGRLLWEHNIAEGAFNYVLNAPARIEDDLYFLTQRGDIVALNAFDGILRWRISTGIKSRAGLTVAGGWVFIGGADGRVSAFTESPPP